METFHAVNRRRFITAAAGGLLATLPVRSVWPVQATGVRRGSGVIGPHWRPSGELLRSLPRLLELASVPCVALAAVDAGSVFPRTAGRVCVDGTVFEAASLGKPLFAYAVLRLVDAGRLDLDRPLYDYLPAPDAAHPLMRRVTARHVLTHTSGLPTGAPTTASATSSWPIPPMAAPSWCSPTAATARGCTSGSSSATRATTTPPSSTPEARVVQDRGAQPSLSLPCAINTAPSRISSTR